MPRGGARRGTPGKGYQNRTDLAVTYDNAQSAASGGMTPRAPQPASAPPAPQAPIPQAPRSPMVGADQVPNLDAPSMRPGEPVTAGLPMGPGAGPEALGPLPPPPMDPVRQIVEALMLTSPNPDLVRILNRLDYEGR